MKLKYVCEDQVESLLRKEDSPDDVQLTVVQEDELKDNLHTVDTGVYI